MAQILTRRWFALGAGLGTALAGLRAEDLPRKAPELAVQLPGGGQLLLSQLRGKVILLEFLHTTCSHCQQTGLWIEHLYTELKPRGFQPVGVAFNDGAAQLVPGFAGELHLTFPVGVAPRNTVLEYLQHPISRPLPVPHMLLIDRKGMIRLEHSGEPGPDLRAKLDELLKEPFGGTQVRAGRKRQPAPKP